MERKIEREREEIKQKNIFLRKNFLYYVHIKMFLDIKKKKKFYM